MRISIEVKDKVVITNLKDTETTLHLISLLPYRYRVGTKNNAKYCGG